MSESIDPKLAFEYESGQFICHIYIEIQNDEDLEYCDFFNEFIKLIEANPIDDNLQKPLWIPVTNLNQVPDDQQAERRSFHITVLRGHHALYYHQIRPFIANLTEECKQIDCFKLYLDELVIFKNYEKTKRFLCLASHTQNELFNNLKKTVQSTLKDFATGLTQECIINEAVPHCSIMWQDIDSTKKMCDEKQLLRHFNHLISKSSVEELGMNINVEFVTVKIGFKTYNIPLNTSRRNLS